MKNNIRWKRILFLIIPVTLISIIVFFFIIGAGSHVSADAGDLNTMKGYESVLVREGDTISSLADSYVEKYSHFSKAKYVEAIISLNNLSSEYIQSGNYLLLPRYR